MEAILIFLAKAIAGGVLSHYIKKALEKIDKDLPDLFERGAATEEISQYVKDKGIEDEIMKFASKTMDRSIIVHLPGEEAFKPEDLTDLFLLIIQTGFTLSYEWKMDLLLPGSLIGPEFYTYFSGNSESILTLKRKDMRIDLGDMKTGVIGQDFYIFPAPKSDGPKSLWHQYLDSIKSSRNETMKYLGLYDKLSFLRSPIDRCEVNAVTAGSCYFAKYMIMNEDKKKALNLDGNKCTIGDWYSGIKNMLDGIQQVNGIRYLEVADKDRIIELSKALSETLDGVQ